MINILSFTAILLCLSLGFAIQAQTPAKSQQEVVKDLQQRLEVRSYIELGMGLIIAFLLWRVIVLSEKAISADERTKHVPSKEKQVQLEESDAHQ